MGTIYKTKPRSPVQRIPRSRLLRKDFVVPVWLLKILEQVLLRSPTGLWLHLGLESEGIFWVVVIGRPAFARHCENPLTLQICCMAPHPQSPACPSSYSLCHLSLDRVPPCFVTHRLVNEPVDTSGSLTVCGAGDLGSGVVYAGVPGSEGGGPCTWCSQACQEPSVLHLNPPSFTPTPLQV